MVSWINSKLSLCPFFIVVSSNTQKGFLVFYQSPSVSVVFLFEKLWCLISLSKFSPFRCICLVAWDWCCFTDLVILSSQVNALFAKSDDLCFVFCFLVGKFLISANRLDLVLLKIVLSNQSSFRYDFLCGWKYINLETFKSLFYIFFYLCRSSSSFLCE